MKKVLTHQEVGGERAIIPPKKNGTPHCGLCRWRRGPHSEECGQHRGGKSKRVSRPPGGTSLHMPEESHWMIISGRVSYLLRQPYRLSANQRLLERPCFQHSSSSESAGPLPSVQFKNTPRRLRLISTGSWEPPSLPRETEGLRRLWWYIRCRGGQVGNRDDQQEEER